MEMRKEDKEYLGFKHGEKYFSNGIVEKDIF
jgi:hypothetical protein